jgi:LETM1-like protein
VGSRDWLLAVVGAISAELQPPLPRLASVRARRDALEVFLSQSGLGYGTGADDPAVLLEPEASAGVRAFALLVGGLLRTCTRAAQLSGGQWFTPEAGPPEEAARARRAQLVAILAAAGDNPKAAAPLFADPLGTSAASLQRLAGKAAARLQRRYLAEGGPFAGLPLHNGLCAIEVRTCATLSLAAFNHGRLSPAACHLAQRAALSWRSVLVELLAGLASAQEKGPESLRGFEQVIRDQRLPAREARTLRAGLVHPRPPEQLAAALASPALRQFALAHVLLAALVDRRFDPGEVAFVDRLAAALRVDAEQLALVEGRVDDFYRRNGAALLALRRAEIPEGLPRAFTSRMQAAVVDNLDRVMQEIRETGELAELLARAAGGQALTDGEKAKVRQQLIDLAKTIPALAIFAAPGGALLLPVLIRLLPFNLLPSSFTDERPRLSLPPSSGTTLAPRPPGSSRSG